MELKFEEKDLVEFNEFCIKERVFIIFYFLFMIFVCYSYDFDNPVLCAVCCFILQFSIDYLHRYELPWLFWK